MNSGAGPSERSLDLEEEYPWQTGGLSYGGETERYSLRRTSHAQSSLVLYVLRRIVHWHPNHGRLSYAIQAMPAWYYLVLKKGDNHAPCLGLFLKFEQCPL